MHAKSKNLQDKITCSSYAGLRGWVLLCLLLPVNFVIDGISAQIYLFLLHFKFGYRLVLKSEKDGGKGLCTCLVICV